MLQGRPGSILRPISSMYFQCSSINVFIQVLKEKLGGRHWQTFVQRNIDVSDPTAAFLFKRDKM